MEKKVVDFIHKHHILSSVHRVVLAVSGGADSMAMAHILLRRFPHHSYVIAHVNHGLRPEADAEERFVADFARSHGAEFCCHRVDVAALAKERKQGIEETGREERYRFFRSLHADRILTAHHKDDQMETVLFHLIRGCGIQGLCGMEPCGGDLARPLLCVTKKEILDYCKKEGICYKTDLSNDDVTYTRNRIRKNIIPLLEEINPNVAESLSRLSESVVDDHLYLEASAQEYYQTYSRREGDACFLQVSEIFETQPAMARRMIRLAVRSFGADLDFDRTEEIRLLKNGKSLPITTGLWVYREKDGFVFGPERKAGFLMEEMPIPARGVAETAHV
ncbi:MAG: tRNA lysidine(34) synthetase TilS, partial [Firmicutes bacterium]|nr:tRNA lysidine(34) synthetase TilS [Bacillota bacterium]